MIYNVQQAADFSASELMLTIWIIHESTEKMTNIHTYIHCTSRGQHQPPYRAKKMDYLRKF